jgi:hypothetical protein
MAREEAYITRIPITDTPYNDKRYVVISFEQTELSIPGNIGVGQGATPQYQIGFSFLKPFSTSIP